jgi:DNA-binding transcriptional MerR regulator
MGDDDLLLTIGNLAQLTGVTVKSIRFWSDEGLVVPVGRTPAGYRLYDANAVVRLGLLRTLRTLDVDLPSIRKVLEREAGLGEVAAAHAAMLDVRIRAMQLHRAVLRVVAARGSTTPQEIDLMNSLARLSHTERRRMVTDFLDDAYDGLDLGPEFRAALSASTPDLPEDPTPDQVQAWVELAELLQDDDFRATVRRVAVEQAQAVAHAPAPEPGAHEALAALLHERVTAAVGAGIEPGTPAAAPVVDEVVAAYAAGVGRSDTPEFRSWLTGLFATSTDRRFARYWQLLAVLGGQTPPPDAGADVEWFAAALAAPPRT